jgi:hypothetical protein
MTLTGPITLSGSIPGAFGIQNPVTVTGTITLTESAAPHEAKGILPKSTSGSMTIVLPAFLIMLLQTLGPIALQALQALIQSWLTPTPSPVPAPVVPGA